ncbi:MAG: UDP-N-acetylmuramoyl-L-alanyl-D-glutamate--2,6-diaminopimelate ligase [Christensenellaceae bacterium]
MKLSELIKDLNYTEIIGSTDREIKDITADSNAVVQDGLFVCISGGNYDGHDFIKQVEDYGGVAAIVEKRLDARLTQIVVKDARQAMSEIAAAFCGHADKKMKMIGVLGTNGKTTTTHLIASILMNAGVKCGLIGTLGIFYGNKFIEPTLTTPDPIELHKTLADMYESGVEAVVMEVSAHAAYLKKVYGLEFETGVFTNLTQDHLDFFGDMESYKKAKISFFKDNACKYVVSNSDDETGREIAETVNGKVLTYGIDSPADVFAIDLNEKPSETTFVLNLFDCIYDVRLNLIGRYNVYNALAAATVCALYGIPPEKVAEGIENLKGVSGRLECVYEGDFSVYIDYAHTPDGLKQSLTALKSHTKNRLICLFGCGGNRDRDKRPIMGAISGEIADFTVLTSDNPRYEEPMEILWQVEKGIAEKTDRYVIIQERAEGIRYALGLAQKGDIILLAGKGSEKYQEVFGIKRPFNDKDYVEEYLRRKK